MAFKYSARSARKHASEAPKVDDKGWRGVVKTYYRLTKPGIIYGNILTTIGGFFLAAKTHPKFWLFIAVVLGTSLVIGSACAFNNFLDRDIDKKMARTKRRALVGGAISGRSALIYASVLGIAGFATLALWVNWLVVAICAVGFVDYVALYDYSKRHSVHGTLVGSISGAMPVVAGYCAVTDKLNGAAFILFAILVLWQMPHFYAIAMYRMKDYAAASIPVLPIKRGMRDTKVQILWYISAFILAVAALTLYGYAGWSFFVVMVLLGFVWLWMGLKGFKAPDEIRWARKMFLFSLVIILVLSAMLCLGAILP